MPRGLAPRIFTLSLEKIKSKRFCGVDRRARTFCKAPTPALSIAVVCAQHGHLYHIEDMVLI